MRPRFAPVAALLLITLPSAVLAAIDPGIEIHAYRQGNWPYDGGALFAFAGVALLARVALLHRDRGSGK